MMRNLAIALSLSFAAAAQQPASAPAAQPAPEPVAAAQPAPAAEKPAPAAAAEKAPADQAVSADGKMHLDAAVAFLKAWGKGRWDDARPVAADKVAVKMGDKSYDVDVASGKSDIKAVLPFRGLSTVRNDGKVVGIAVSELAVTAGGAEKRGKARLTTEDKDGQVRVTAVELE
jgi:pyruvate dehydrogenase E2 component (dihydrolipoamide acetyltransferase)